MMVIVSASSSLFLWGKMTLAPNWSRTWCVREGQSGMEGGMVRRAGKESGQREEIRGRRKGKGGERGKGGDKGREKGEEMGKR